MKILCSKKWLARLVFLSVFILLGNYCYGKQEQPEWVQNYGTKTPSLGSGYIIGFGMRALDGAKEEALADAKTQATGDLSRKVQVSVQTTVTSEVNETEETISSSFNSVSHTISNLELKGISFKIASEDEMIYALAYLDRDKAVAQYREKAKQTLERIRTIHNQASDFEQKGNTSEAIEQYVRLYPLYKSYYEQYAIANTLSGSESKAFDELTFETGGDDSNSLVNPRQLVAQENEVRKKIKKLTQKPVGSLSDALEVLVNQLKMQQVEIANNQVRNFRYQESDFSSEFGSYVGQSLQRKILSAFQNSKSSSKTITQGYYWDLGEEIEMSVTVNTEQGQRVAGAEVRLPKSGVPEKLELKPQNHEQALKTKEALSEGAIVDGGINVEVMSDKGSNGSSIVLNDGEDINFYFRVNQPSFLRLTYILANGMKVMLWDSYYIGTDRVNKVVAFPHTFEAAPPLGVERLIVTAYSKQPPKQNIVRKTINGQVYKVIPDEVSEMVAQTRGLKVKGDKMMRVGMDDLSITTISK
ncbi:hypothetical protein [Fodinibius halophilus]|uniref:DUF4384 domain-containing protein n=1 Tax=Fodinibius halophilus TaxID=1736908 RepID=A0A6M1TMT6_9BACT|nr:hypothetical protein [Fodinibius halophilus]NGP89670.1 hypothetical protein [Fodinibius halophilus]